ncbi:uncharacterized protein LOC123318765 isoform X2 [Coccinella septempunctata]|uniref:uncharacterized protein LOC123318765 isoform X2 n=1 Tax=Coccinella septempunctata TaxID=41139 RepID=UPI001D076E6C|nr:uncharacterized protein LOC123318765 isoform X2 [Coccinella septempunctata]
MNKVGCKCLNIIIESESDLCDVGHDQLELTIEERQDIFFKSDNLRQVEKLDNISKSLPGLVETREVGSWIIHYCINCKVHTHAVHKKKGASCVIIHPSLLTEEDIKRLWHSENFSKAYKIVVDIGKFIDDNDDIFYPSEMDSLMAGIKQNATEVLKKEAALIEERIKKYTEDQYYMLDVLRERLSSEEQTLMRTVLEHFTQTSDKDDKNSYKFLRAHDEVVPQISKKYSERASSQAMSKKAAVEDSEFDDLLFPFDGMDERPTSDHEESVELESDVEDDEKPDRYQSRARSSSIKFAKSLPMDIPAFMKLKKHHTIDISDDESLPEEKNIDIAASIKKLAKSVHGSEIFGDLPRPRFSTQL